MSAESDDADERFDRTLRNLLNTPPQPRKGTKAAEEATGRDKPGRPRSGKRQEERGERG